MHIQQLGVLQSAFEGLEDAGIPLHEIYRTRTGTYYVARPALSCLAVPMGRLPYQTRPLSFWLAPTS